MIGRGSSLTSVSARYEDMTFHNILLQNKVEALSSWVPEAEMTKDQTGYHFQKNKIAMKQVSVRIDELLNIQVQEQKYLSRSSTIANLWYNHQKGFS